jgi:hypothetical protein
MLAIRTMKEAQGAKIPFRGHPGTVSVMLRLCYRRTGEFYQAKFGNRGPGADHHEAAFQGPFDG